MSSHGPPWVSLYRQEPSHRSARRVGRGFG
jgi:hypothetical protein